MSTSSFISLYIFYAMTIGYFCHALLHYRISTLRVVFFQLSFWATGRTIGRHVHKPFGFGCLNVTCTALCNQWSFFFMFFVFTIYTKLLFWEKERTKKTCGVPWRVLFARLKCAPSHFAFMNTFPTFLGNQSWLLLTSCPRDGVCGLFKQAYIYTMYMLTLIQGSYQGNNFLSLRSCGCIISSKFQQFKLIWFKRWQLLFFFVRFIFMFVSIKRHHLLSEWDIAK